jgi:RNA-directed DNA polymerase
MACQKSVRASIKAHFDIDLDVTSNADFYHLAYNLYLVKTPENGDIGVSRIEDLFPEEILKMKLDGKSFNPNRKLEPLSEYGKAVFAEKVVVPNAHRINWGSFAPLVSRINEVIIHYSISQSRRATAPLALEQTPHGQ